MRSCLLFILTLFYYISPAQTIKISKVPGWLVKPVLENGKKTDPEDISNGYLLNVYERQVNLVNQTVYTHYTRKIINETGVQNASEVSVYYAPQYQQLSFHQINLIRNGKVISSVKEAEIKVVDVEDEASDFLYNGTKRAYVLLKGVEKNDEIDFAYSVTGFNPVFGKHYSDKIYFVSGIQIENYFESIITAAAVDLSFRVFNGAPLPEEKINGDIKVYQWNNPSVGTWKWQAGTPLWYEKDPYVSISSYKDWKEVITWGTNLFRNYKYPLPAALMTLIEQWRKTAGDDKSVYAALATRFVQEQIRYLGLEIGTHTHEPHSPEDVFTHRFGDCKDKALLLAAILRQQNIEAYVALVNTTAKQTLEQALPTGIAFNHAIVAIAREEEDGYQYVDPTITGQRGSFTNLFVPNYGYALVLNEKETALHKAHGTDLNNTEIAEIFHLSYSGNSKMNVKTSYSGKAADRNRDNFGGISNKKLSENYLEYYAKYYEGIQADGPVVIRDDSMLNEISVVENYTIPDAWEEDEDNKKVFSFASQTIYEKVPDPSGMPEGMPVALEFPLKIVHSIQLHMPQDWPESFTPLHIANEAYKFDFTPRVDGEIIYLEYYFKTLKDHIPASMLAEYKKDYDRIRKKMEFGLYTTDRKSSSPTDSGDFNVAVFFIFLTSLTAMIFLMKFLNKRKIETGYNENTAWTIGGWTAVLGISLVLNVLLNTYNLFDSGYFKDSTWDALQQTGGNRLKAVAFTEFILMEFSMVFGVSLLIWYFKRRDIFPVMFTWFIISLLASQFILLASYMISPSPEITDSLATDTATQLVKTLIYGGVWVTYLQKSERVKSTFLKSYAGTRQEENHPEIPDKAI